MTGCRAWCLALRGISVLWWGDREVRFNGLASEDLYQAVVLFLFLFISLSVTQVTAVPNLKDVDPHTVSSERQYPPDLII